MNVRMYSLFIAMSALLIAGCGDDGDKDAAPATGGPPAVSTLATPAISATASKTSTSSATNPPTIATAVATLPVGGTTTVTTRAVPAGSTAQGILKEVRTGLHPEIASERIVFEFQAGVLPAARVEYIAAAQQCASGMNVAIAGGAVLNVVFTSAVAHDTAGKATILAATTIGTGAPITEAKQTCDFEGQVAWAVGVKAKQAFVVSQLADPPRLVIDIKQ